MPTLTLAALQQRVLNRLDNNVALYATAEITYAINEAIKCLNLATGFLNTSVILPVPTEPNRVWFDIPGNPPNIFLPLRVQYEKRYLSPLSPNQIGATNPTWTQSNTTNTGLPVTYWIPSGLRKFGIYPADAVGGGQLMVTGIQCPAPLVNATDVVPFPNEVLIAFDLLAAHTLQLKESSEEFAQSSDDYKRYLSQIKKITIWRGWVSPRYYSQRGQQDNREITAP